MINNSIKRPCNNKFTFSVIKHVQEKKIKYLKPKNNKIYKYAIRKQKLQQKL